MIDKAKITNPHMWQLVIEISMRHLRAMVFCPTADDSLQWVEAPLTAAASPRQMLEEAVYNIPALTEDYGRVTVLWQSERFAPIPGFVTDPELARDIFRRQFVEELSEGAVELLTDTLDGIDTRLVYEVPADMLNFVRRTFNNPRIMHALSPAALWFAAKCHGRRRGKTLANLRGDRLDLVMLGEGTPLVINSFDIMAPADAVYYILAARRAFSLDETDEVMLAGDAELRAAVASLLRRYARYVMPAIFPADMFRLGRPIMNVPFEMVVTPSVI